MADQSSIFNENSQTPATPQAPSNGANAQPNTDVLTLLSAIKNERGEPKYKTVEDAITALRHSQEYIPQLKQTIEQRDAELSAARAAADKITELERTLQTLTQNDNPRNNPSTEVSEEKIAELVNRTLTNKQREDMQKQNLSTVVKKVQEKFGAEAEATFYKKAQEHGMDVATFNNLAATSPKAVLTLLGITDATPQPNIGSVTNTPGANTSGFQPAETTFIGLNTKPTLIGATSDDLRNETQNARKMVDELHAQGKQISDLTDPKVYFKHFRKG